MKTWFQQSENVPKGKNLLEKVCLNCTVLGSWDGNVFEVHSWFRVFERGNGRVCGFLPGANNPVCSPLNMNWWLRRVCDFQVRRVVKMSRWKCPCRNPSDTWPYSGIWYWCEVSNNEISVNQMSHNFKVCIRCHFYHVVSSTGCPLKCH
jgi:hypothetical protein